jgi:rubrerythrin
VARLHSSQARTMPDDVQDVMKELSYYSLYDVAEKARWKISDIPWDDLDQDAVSDDLIRLVRRTTFGELTTYSATRSFMELFTDDIDFTQWLAVWLYEETKHPHAFVKWLSLVGESVTGDTITEGRKITPMTRSKVEMLTFNIISEIVAGTNYLRTSTLVREPVLALILKNIGRDEMRHSQGFEHYCRQMINGAEDPDRERLRCLRATFAFLNGDQSVSHPVFLTEQDIRFTIEEKQKLVHETRAQIRKQVARKIAAVTGVSMPDPDKAYDVYVGFKNEYYERRKQA